MDSPPLDNEELSALREAMQDASGAPVYGVDESGAESLSLIADDRTALSARPAALRIAERWARELREPIQSVLGPEASTSVLGADTIDGPSVREGLAAMWTSFLSPEGRGIALVGVSGGILEAIAVRLLGDDTEIEESERVASLTAIRLFEPVGDTLTTALVDAWGDEQGCRVTPVAAPSRDELRSLFDAEMVIGLRIGVSGPVDGQILCVASPETLAAPPLSFDAIPAARGAVEQALNEVLVDVCVELGSTEVSPRELMELTVGSVIELGTFVDDLLTIECAGVTKAHGTAVVHRGMLAVEVSDAPQRGRNSR